MSDIILSDKTLKWKSPEDDENENVNENVNDETLMSSDKDDDADDDDDDDDDDEMIKILMYSIEYAETTDQNEKNITIKKLIDCFDKMIMKSKSFEDQTES